MKRMLKRIGFGIVAVFLVSQLVPYGRNHTNPPVSGEPAWDSPRTEELFARACADCHSNATTWPIASSIAPLSWLIQRDVEEGRETLNVSTWDQPAGGEGEQEEGEGGDEIGEVIREGEMPPWYYLPLHPGARLSAAEQDDLVRGLTTTFADSPPGSG